MRKLAAGLGVVVWAFAVQAVDLPTMGWSSWNTYRVNISEELIKRQADALVDGGFAAVGYKYVNIDDGWFDVPSTIEKPQCLELEAMVHKYQPGCLINGRLGYGLGDYETPGDNMIADTTAAGKLYETVDTMNDSWGYRPTDTHYKSVKDILAIKQKCASIGSNYMLNVGPDSLGRFPVAAIEILSGLAQG